MSDRFSISISKMKEHLWDIWSEHPKNARDKSGAIMRLIEKEVSENKETYGVK